MPQLICGSRWALLPHIHMSHVTPSPVHPITGQQLLPAGNVHVVVTENWHPSPGLGTQGTGSSQHLPGAPWKENSTLQPTGPSNSKESGTTYWQSGHCGATELGVGGGVRPATKNNGTEGGTEDVWSHSMGWR